MLNTKNHWLSYSFGVLASFAMLGVSIARAEVCFLPSMECDDLGQIGDDGGKGDQPDSCTETCADRNSNWTDKSSSCKYEAKKESIVCGKQCYSCVECNDTCAAHLLTDNIADCIYGIDQSERPAKICGVTCYKCNECIPDSCVGFTIETKPTSSSDTYTSCDPGCGKTKVYKCADEYSKMKSIENGTISCSKIKNCTSQGLYNTLEQCNLAIGNETHRKCIASGECYMAVNNCSGSGEYETQSACETANPGYTCTKTSDERCWVKSNKPTCSSQGMHETLDDCESSIRYDHMKCVQNGNCYEMVEDCKAYEEWATYGEYSNGDCFEKTHIQYYHYYTITNSTSSEIRTAFNNYINEKLGSGAATEYGFDDVSGFYTYIVPSQFVATPSEKRSEYQPAISYPVFFVKGADGAELWYKGGVFYDYLGNKKDAIIIGYTTDTNYAPDCSPRGTFLDSLSAGCSYEGDMFESYISDTYKYDARYQNRYGDVDITLCGVENYYVGKKLEGDSAGTCSSSDWKPVSYNKPLLRNKFTSSNGGNGSSNWGSTTTGDPIMGGGNVPGNGVGEHIGGIDNGVEAGTIDGPRSDDTIRIQDDDSAFTP